MVVYGNCSGSALTPLTLLLAQTGKMEESKPSELGSIAMGGCFVKDWTWFVVPGDDLISERLEEPPFHTGAGFPLREKSTFR